ncbi:MAG: hypothetical protein ACREMP_09545 [Candidatus Tyrphobacter sp.]
MLVADMRPEIPHPVLARTVGTRVGEGLGERGELDLDAAARTLSVLAEYTKGARERGAEIVVVATSALRRAENSQAFSQRVRERTGKSLRILSGEEEARLSFRGAVGSLQHFEGTSGVLDVGGGSTEYATGSGSIPKSGRSHEIGAVRLTERIPSLSGRRGTVDEQSLAQGFRIAAEALAPLSRERQIDRLLLVGGSATTTAAVASLDSTKAPELSRQVLTQTLARLCSLDLEGRKAVAGMRPQRADILPAGIIILATAMELVRHSVAIVAPGDLLVGVLLEERERGTAASEPKETE